MGRCVESLAASSSCAQVQVYQCSTYVDNSFNLDAQNKRQCQRVTLAVAIL